MIVEHIHGAQQVLMVGRRLGKAEAARQGHRLQPAQHPELGVRIAQPVEHHRPDGWLHRSAVAGTAEHARETVHVKVVVASVMPPIAFPPSPDGQPC